jgi:hypothetical protein
LVNTMSTPRREEWNMVEGSACSCFSSHMEASISCNGNKNVVNYIMDACALIDVKVT